MLSRLWDRFTHWLERRFVRGAQYRLLLVVALIGLISILGGAAVLALGTGFDRLGEAVWWAFLRLTDPGYLGDDVGAVNRTLSTVLTVLGYVVFLGALVAIMTQGLDARMEWLESGLTPVARDDHVLVLGWTNRTDTIVRELLLSEGRVRRFLRRQGARSLHIVILAERVDATLVQDLRDAVGEAWDEKKVTLRSGSPLRMEHLARVDHLNASVIVVPGSEFETGGIARTDSYTVKTLLSLRSDPAVDPGEEARVDAADLPLVVAEIFDTRKVGIGHRAYPGPLEILASDAVVSRLLAQNIRHRGLSRIYNELLTHEGGSEVYLREHPELDGLRFEVLSEAFGESILLGVVRHGEGGEHEPHLNPPPGFRVRATDRFVHLAGDYERTILTSSPPDEAWPRGRPGREDPGGTERSILILGWNHKVPALVHELGTYDRERFRIGILSTIAPSRREKVLERHGVGDRLTVEHLEGDYGELVDLKSADPTEHDTVVLVGSDRMQAEEASDARTIVGSLLLDEIGLPNDDTQTIFELLDPENVSLVDAARGEVIISPLIVSHMLAHVALRPELRSVFAELFTAGGAEIDFQPIASYEEEAGAGRSISFQEVRRAAHARGEIALGMQTGTRAADVVLNPPPGRRYPVESGVEVVSVVTFR